MKISKKRHRLHNLTNLPKKNVTNAVTSMKLCRESVEIVDNQKHTFINNIYKQDVKELLADNTTLLYLGKNFIGCV